MVAIHAKALPPICSSNTRRGLHAFSVDEKYETLYQNRSFNSEHEYFSSLLRVYVLFYQMSLTLHLLIFLMISDHSLLSLIYLKFQSEPIR